MKKRSLLIFFLLNIYGAFGQDANGTDTIVRSKRVLPAFQFIKFPNDGCDGGTRNGTCYTTDECTNKGGTTSGTCANGFGVCCLFVLGCSGTSSANNTYLVQGSITTLSGHNCKYTICKTSPSICRIRFDFTAFNIAGPGTGTSFTLANNAQPADLSGNVGQCHTDTFVVTTSGSKSSPVICGANTGQHMIVDAGDSNCVNVNYYIGGSTATTRNWDVKVTQFDCGDQNGGPMGCLQYFTGTTKNFASFNFPLSTTTATLTNTITHLANQDYDICIRRESGYCFICYQPVLMPAVGAGAGATSYGLGNLQGGFADPPGPMPVLDNLCSTDYLSFNGVSTRANTLANGVLANTRICGRVFNTAAGGDHASVCTSSTPFRLSFITDGFEEVWQTAVTSNEEHADPPGTRGFLLSYTQLACGTTA